LGAAVGYLSLWLLYWTFRLTTGQEGLGYGDFKLLAALGAWCGWQEIPVIALAAALSGIVGYFAFNNLNKNNHAISFGPYLAFAGIVVFMGQSFAFTI
jgi:leader peptidase (prepilin peptidase)/N-methyltransferase